MKRFLVAVACLLILTTATTASDKKTRGRAAWAWATSQPSVWAVNSPGFPDSSAVKESLTAQSCPDALAEVNAARADRGLPPFQHDPLLTQAAFKAASERARRGITGHLPEGDFTCLPVGASADAAGCAGLDPSWGWQSCCWDELGYTHAGAAWVIGPDGKRYNHIFVANRGRQEPVVQPLQRSFETVQPAPRLLRRRGSG